MIVSVWGMGGSSGLSRVPVIQETSPCVTFVLNGHLELFDFHTKKSGFLSGCLWVISAFPLPLFVEFPGASRHCEN